MLCVSGVEDRKANSTITILSLNKNKIGDAGACALANALTATLVTFPHSHTPCSFGHDGYGLALNRTKFLFA